MDIRTTARRRRCGRYGAILACGAALTAASSAYGQAPSAEDVASARVLGTEGVRRAEAGDCPSAIVKLEAAERLYHAPTTLERLGECQIKVGHLVDGTESLNRVVRETLPPNAPQAFVVAQQRAGQVLAVALPRIAKLRIHVDGGPTDKVTVMVDGVGVPVALFDADRPTDPGPHQVTATAPGYREATASVQLPEAGSSSVSLKLDPDPNAMPVAVETIPTAPQPSAPAGASPGESLGPAEPPASRGPNRVPAFIALGIGGVGVAVGSVFGIMALGTKSTLDNGCPNHVCRSSSSQSDIDALATRATVSNIGFGVGVVGLAVGAVLLATAHGGEARTAAASSHAHVEPWLGLGAAGLGGTFE